MIGVRKIKSKCLKIIVFLLLTCFLLAIMQSVFLPKWYYPSVESETISISGFYAEPNDSLQVLTLGPSHMLFGYSPCEVYEKYGITSYNLATASQLPISTYYLLKEALKTQSPQIVVCDVSGFFKKEFEEPEITKIRVVLDQMPLSSLKYEFASKFVTYEGNNSSMWDIMFPILQYHDRWSGLDKRDFTEYVRNKHYFVKGYAVRNDIIGTDTVEEDMNNDVNDANHIESAYIVEYESGIANTREYEKDFYDSAMSKEGMEWIFKIRDLCKKNNIELLLVKIPDINNIFTYKSSWTKEKSDNVKGMCDRYNIEYFDLMYDSNHFINWKTDTVDQGMHLNTLGAIKISDILGNYFMENYNLDKNYNEIWNSDLVKYKKIRDYVIWTAENNFIDYLNKLNDNLDGKVVLIAVEDDCLIGMSDETKEKLRLIGIMSNFDDGFRNSFVAVIEDGRVVYEALSNDKINYNGDIREKISYSVLSAGYYAGRESQIVVNGIDYAMKGIGFNIVVYDVDSDMVVDSVRFSMHEPEKAFRNNYEVWDRLERYQNYIIGNT